MMVQPGTNPSPGEPFHDQNASDRADGGLEGVVEELRNVLSGLGNDTVENTAPVEEQQPAPADKHFPFSPVIESPHELPIEPELERGPLQEATPPSDADFWNGNVLGWSDKAPDGTSAEPEEIIAPLEPAVDREPEPQPAKSSIEDLLPPLPPSPFDAIEAPPSPPPLVTIAPAAPVVLPTPVEKAPPPIEAPLPVDIVMPAPPEAEPQPVASPPTESQPSAQIPQTTEKPALVEVHMDKPEGLVQIACIYPKGFEKQGQQFVTTLRSACAAAKLTIVIQPVYIQPWDMAAIDVTGWAQSAHTAGADRMFVMASKKDQAHFKNVVAEAASAGVVSRLILLEHVGLRTLYADILVELRRP